jgi:hypothetical protein
MKKDNLVTTLDDFFKELLKEVSPGETSEDEKASTITFSDRLKVFQAGVNWIATKNRLETEDTEDAFSKLRRRSTGGPGRSSAAGAATASGAANGSGSH